MLAILAFLAISNQTGQGVLGADRVMRDLEASEPSDAPTKLELEIRKFNASAASLSPQAAANGWLKLLDKFEGGIGVASSDGTKLGLDAMVTALPDPAAWPLVRKALPNRRPTENTPALAVLFDRLEGDDEAALRDCEALRAQMPKPAFPGFGMGDVDDVELGIAIRKKDAALMGDALARQVKGSPFPFSFEGVPDVAGILGPDKARPVLRKILEAATGTFEKVNGAETRRIARAIMLDDLANLTAPQWSLAVGPEAGDVVEKLVARFGENAFESRGRWNAASLYVALLLRTQQIDHAVKFLSAQGDGQISLSAVEIPPEDLYPELTQVLDRLPTAPLWDDVIAAAAKLGKLAEVRTRLEKALSDPALAGPVRVRLLVARGDLAASMGDVKGATTAYLDAARHADRDYHGEDPAPKLFALARAANDDETLRAVLSVSPPAGSGSRGSIDMFPLLMNRGRLADAEREALRGAKAVDSNSQEEQPWNTALELAEIYYRANRPADVMELIDGFRAWPQADLFPPVALRRDSSYREPYRQRALGFYAAWAFAGTGKKALAIQTLHDLLCGDMTDDDAYELLNKLEGKQALAFYDELSRFDPYAPRAVAWKADLLMKLGRLAQAERLARASIFLDPTDGAAPAGRRLTSYSILARVLRAEGKNGEAGLMERVVKAVRIGERADLYRDAGLVPQALKLYQESNGMFVDAYCVHARLASMLDALGRTAEAAEHLKRAYELMPSQFGEIGSLCLGCESALEGAERQNLARAVFEKMALEEPNKPQVLCLLGQVYAQQGDTAKALDNLQKAVRLDPRYLNAWKSIVEIASSAGMPPAEAEGAANTLVRLDPLGLHGGAGFGSSCGGSTTADALVKDYGTLWRIYQRALAGLPPARTGPLYPLKKVANARVRTPWDLPRQPGDELRKGPLAPLARSGELSGICRLQAKE